MGGSGLSTDSSADALYLNSDAITHTHTHWRPSGSPTNEEHERVPGMGYWGMSRSRKAGGWLEGQVHCAYGKQTPTVRAVDLGSCLAWCGTRERSGIRVWDSASTRS